MVSITGTAIHGVATSVGSTARGTFGAKMTCLLHNIVPACPNYRTIEPAAQIGNMSNLSVLLCVESKISLNLLGMTLLAATALLMTLCTRAQLSTTGQPTRYTSAHLSELGQGSTHLWWPLRYS